MYAVVPGEYPCGPIVAGLVMEKFQFHYSVSYLHLWNTKTGNIRQLEKNYRGIEEQNNR